MLLRIHCKSCLNIENSKSYRYLCDWEVFSTKLANIVACAVSVETLTFIYYQFQRELCSRISQVQYKATPYAIMDHSLVSRTRWRPWIKLRIRFRDWPYPEPTLEKKQDPDPTLCKIRIRITPKKRISELKICNLKNHFPSFYTVLL